MCIAFSVSIVFGISQERGEKKGERKLYIGTSKKVYFTIPLAVEDRYYL